LLPGFIALTAVIMVTGAFWWNIIIPAKRTELALSKSKGMDIYVMFVIMKVHRIIFPFVIAY
jgi:hypothetical protein